MKLFPTVVAGIFVGLALIAVVIFATFSARGTEEIGPVAIWGSVSETAMQNLLGVIQSGNTTYSAVTYRYLPEDQLIPALISAIASGQSPDMVLLPASAILSEESKLLLIPYTSLSRRDFTDSYIEAAEVLLRKDGMLGLPLVADPLVMYWNRSLFSEAAIARPPAYWDELALNAPLLTKTTTAGTLTQSAAALGTWGNVLYAKPIFLSLLKQLGNPVVSVTETGYRSALNEWSEGSSSGASALRFYSEFADPVKPVYSWNRSQALSRDAFVAGKLAVYFGRASEAFALRAANPNLNFDVARLPAMRGGGSQTETNLIALSVPRGAPNPKGALAVAQALTGPELQPALEQEFHMPSVRRDFEPDASPDQYQTIFRASALSSFSFFDPNPAESDRVFQTMIDGVSSGADTVSEAVSQASDSLDALFSRVQ